MPKGPSSGTSPQGMSVCHIGKGTFILLPFLCTLRQFHSRAVPLPELASLPSTERCCAFLGRDGFGVQTPIRADGNRNVHSGNEIVLWSVTF